MKYELFFDLKYEIIELNVKYIQLVENILR